MEACTDTLLGCMSSAQWLANVVWAFVGGMFIYGYIFYNGLKQSPTTEPKLDVLHWLTNPKNWARILINTLAVLIIIRTTGPLSVPEAIALGLGIEGIVEGIVHKFSNPIN